MSKPRYYWFYSVKQMIVRYNILKKCESFDCLQEALMYNAIQKALDDTKNLIDGDKRIIAIQDVLFDKRMTYIGVGYKLHYSERTIQNWINDFIKLVGKYAGYKT